MKSKMGWTLLGLYIITCIGLIWTQGLFGESFIVIILGAPWSLFFAFFEFWGAMGALLLVLIFIPLIINGAILYWIGSLIGRALARSSR